MQEFTFVIVTADRAAGTLTVLYKPVNTALSVRKHRLGVPNGLLTGTEEEILAKLRQHIIRCAPQQQWQDEIDRNAIAIPPSLDSYVGREDLPPATITEIESVLNSGQ